MVALGRVGVGMTRLVEHPPGLDPHLVHVREKVEEQGVHVRRGQGDSPYDQRRDESREFGRELREWEEEEEAG